MGEHSAFHITVCLRWNILGTGFHITTKYVTGENIAGKISKLLKSPDCRESDIRAGAWLSIAHVVENALQNAYYDERDVCGYGCQFEPRAHEALMLPSCFSAAFTVTPGW